MRGRKPTPTKLKLLRGNPGKRKLNGKEPQPGSSIPSIPKGLDKEAQAEWKRIVQELHPLGLLSELDRSTLVAYCTSWATLLEAEWQLARNGRTQQVVGMHGDSYLKPSPWIKIANEARKQMLATCHEFGLSPSARSRLSVKEPEREPDPFDIYERED